MNRTSAVLLIAILSLGWLVFHFYGDESTRDLVDDIQAYQSRSLLPED